MIFIYYLLFFILGIIFIQWLFPILDNLTTTICAKLEVKKSFYAVTVTKNNQIITSEEDENKVSVVGFSIPKEETWKEKIND